MAIGCYLLKSYNNDNYHASVYAPSFDMAPPIYVEMVTVQATRPELCDTYVSVFKKPEYACVFSGWMIHHAAMLMLDYVYKVNPMGSVTPPPDTISPSPYILHPNSTAEMIEKAKELYMGSVVSPPKKQPIPMVETTGKTKKKPKPKDDPNKRFKDFEI
jgi:hypothetical protein